VKERVGLSGRARVGDSTAIRLRFSTGFFEEIWRRMGKPDQSTGFNPREICGLNPFVGPFGVVATS
jgi:hypothetical protein